MKLTKSGVDRKIIELLKFLTGLFSSFTSLYFTLMKYVWSRENARKQESHELGKEAKTEIVYLNSTKRDKKTFSRTNKVDLEAKEKTTSPLERRQVTSVYVAVVSNSV